jgi:hypothetical protein
MGRLGLRSVTGKVSIIRFAFVLTRPTGTRLQENEYEHE